MPDPGESRHKRETFYDHYSYLTIKYASPRASPHVIKGITGSVDPRNRSGRLITINIEGQCPVLRGTKDMYPLINTSENIATSRPPLHTTG